MKRILFGSILVGQVIFPSGPVTIRPNGVIIIDKWNSVTPSGQLEYPTKIFLSDEIKDSTPICIEGNILTCKSFVEIKNFIKRK